jgi:hypothetical protein
LFGALVANNLILNVAGIGMKNQIAPSLPKDVSDNQVIGNLIDTCQSGIVWASASVNGNANHFRDTIIVSNTVRNASNYGIYHTTAVGSKLSNNVIDGCAVNGIYLAGFSGEVSSNVVRNTPMNGINATIDDFAVIRANDLVDCALNQDSGTATSSEIYHILVSRATTAVVATPTVLLESNVHRSTGADPATLAKIVRTGSSVAVMWKDVINLTSKGWQFDTAGELLYANVAYSPDADFTVGSYAAPATPVAGRGRRDFYGTQSPADAAMTSFFRQGDICWKADVAADGPVGWVCIQTGSPGLWRPFGAPNG